MCTKCSGFGHKTDDCISEQAVLVVEGAESDEDTAVDALAFAAADNSGKYSAMNGSDVGGGALGKQVVSYIADSAATCNMTPDADGLTNYRESSRPLGLAGGGDFYRRVR
ncbi:unnamed protein product [Pylaiella littoralis]